MFDDVIKIEGNEKGKTSTIIVGVHGDEICGLEALKVVLPTLKILRGTVFVIYGNPRAIQMNKRFTETNLNRMFKNEFNISDLEKNSYEYKRAQFLKKYLDQSDFLLDIHASFIPGSKPFLICEKNAIGIAEYLPADTVVSGFDQIEPGGTDYYMNSIGKVGICVECGYLGDVASSTDLAKRSIFSFLGALGHISFDLVKQKQSYIRMFNLYKTKSDKFSLERPFIDFEEVLKGQVLGFDGGEEVISEKNSIILFAKNSNQIDDEVFLLGEKKDGFA